MKREGTIPDNVSAAKGTKGQHHLSFVPGVKGYSYEDVQKDFNTLAEFVGLKDTPSQATLIRDRLVIMARTLVKNGVTWDTIEGLDVVKAKKGK